MAHIIRMIVHRVALEYLEPPYSCLLDNNVLIDLEKRRYSFSNLVDMGLVALYASRYLMGMESGEVNHHVINANKISLIQDSDLTDVIIGNEKTCRSVSATITTLNAKRTKAADGTERALHPNRAPDSKTRNNSIRDKMYLHTTKLFRNMNVFLTNDMPLLYDIQLAHCTTGILLPDKVAASVKGFSQYMREKYGTRY